MSNGYFITFEGGEGAGKTTQISALAKSLSEQGHLVVTTREPGGTEEAEAIRNLLVQREGGNWDPIAETLLLYAARVMHVNDVIKPALDNGSVVICDRFSDSTMAYQGYGRGADISIIKAIELQSINNFQPDLTILLDIDVKEGLMRSNSRLKTEQGDDQTEDRFERMDISFHERLRQGFLTIAKEQGERVLVFNADQDAGKLSENIEKSILQRIAQRIEI